MYHIIGRTMFTVTSYSTIQDCRCFDDKKKRSTEYLCLLLQKKRDNKLLAFKPINSVFELVLTENHELEREF